MKPWTARLAPGAGPLVVVCGLAVLDHWSLGPAPFAGVLAGMGMLAVLMALAWWGTQRLTPLPRALQSALRSAAEGALGVVLVFLLVAPLTVLLPQPWVVELFRDDRATDLMTMLILGVGLVVAARAIAATSRQAARRAEAERDAATTRAELAERDRELARAELQLLRAQVEPHFLWNTLGNVEYLIRKDPPRAAAMMADLIAYLRSSVPDGRKSGSTLGSEFASVRAYLGLMQFRMGDRFQFDLALAPEATGQPFPPLVLQTLVENAVRHGLEPLPGPARLLVRGGPSATQPDRLVVEVIDNGLGLQPQPRTRGTGLGLRQVRDRLQAVYGRQAALSVAGQEGGGVCARIECPRGESLTNPVATP